MIRSSHSDQSIYREVLKHAFRTAWHDRRYWLLSVLAGILVTAGSYDILWRAVTSITAQGEFISTNVGKTVVQNVLHAGQSASYSLLSILGGLEIVMLMALIMVAVFVLSCVAQGGLVFALGAKKHGQDATLKEAFRVGGRALWPIVALNILALAVLWILRFLGALPLFLALEQTTATTYLIYIVSFAIFIPLSFATSILQIFALNGLILQGAPIGEAVRRGYAMLKKYWVVIAETAVIQVILSLAIWFLFLLAVMIVLIPAFVLLITALIIPSNGLLALAIVIGSLFFGSALIIAAAFTIQLQYATWTYLYRRLGEGGVVPKIHRLIRNVSGYFQVPQA